MKPVVSRPYSGHLPPRAPSHHVGQRPVPHMPVPHHPGYPHPYQYATYYPYYPPYPYPHSAPPQHPPKVTSSTEAKTCAPQPKSSVPQDQRDEKTEESEMEDVENIVPHSNDVLLGRGGKNNAHQGNERLREMARGMREKYITLRKKDKSGMARKLVQMVHELKPPGRFLRRDQVTMAWELVDLDIAREKTSQCLRDAVAEMKPSTPENDQEMKMETSQPANAEEESSRPSTPVQSNRPALVEASPPRRQSIDFIIPPSQRNRLASWDDSNHGSMARYLDESDPGSFVRNRFESWESSSSAKQHMYAWASNFVANMEVDDATVIPLEDMDLPMAHYHEESFGLLDVSQLYEEETNAWQPATAEESESPFDSEFF